jgi:hypothetical protein
MNIEDSAGYKSLANAVKKDETDNPNFHDYRGKLDWIVNRAKHYAKKTGLDPTDILNSWEKDRNYWYMNYYQDSNQPEIKGDFVRVFETFEDLKKNIKKPEFRCPSCGGVSKNPYKCTCDKCDWKSYGLFGTAGKGVFVFIKKELKGEEIFKPIAWENN